MSFISWIWLILTVMFVLLTIYPYVLYPFLLKMLPKKPVHRGELPDVHDLDIALLFCAYNEENALPNKINNIRHLKNAYPNLKVYAYSDGSTDNTNQLLLSAQDVLQPVIGKQRLGKVLGMQRLVSMVKEDIIVFTDANVLLEKQSLTNLLRYFTDDKVGCVSGQLIYQDIDTITAKVGDLYWKLEEKIKRLETETGSTMGADGAIFARRRRGYPKLPPDVVDDMATSISVLFEDMRCISATDVIAYENAVSSSVEEFKRKIRIACGAYSTYLHQKDDLRLTTVLDQFKFISHKVLRWWGAFFIMSAIFSFVMLGYSIGYDQGNTALATVAVAGSMLWFFGKQGIPGISAIYEIVISIFATGIGVLQSLRGRKYPTWEVATTR